VLALFTEKFTIQRRTLKYTSFFVGLYTSAHRHDERFCGGIKARFETRLANKEKNVGRTQTLIKL
jgi:hypothetical protein